MSSTVSYKVLFDAILSMDSYNRGYNAGIDLKQVLGLLVPSDDPDILIGDVKVLEADCAASAQHDGFYAIAYQYSNGPVTIAYRGTDQFVSGLDVYGGETIGGDIPNAYGIGAGTIDAFASQGVDALNFYQAAVSALNVPANQLAPVTLTGHSLGGGLAGYVAAITNQSANIFESMAYQQAAKATTGNTNLSFTSINAYDIEGQALDAITLFGAGLISQSYYLQLILGAQPDFHGADAPPGNTYSLGQDVDLPNSDSFDKHDASLTVIRMYAETEAAAEDAAVQALSPDAWEEVGQYFWPVLFDNAFAEAIGINTHTYPGRFSSDYPGFLVKYVTPFNGDSEVMRNLIAYSAINSGTELFGDTGIRAFYNDANELGDAYSTAQSKSELELYAKDISEVFTQYAADLAINQISTQGTNNNDWRASGVIDYKYDVLNNIHTLTVDMSDKTWTFKETGDAAKIYAQADFLDKAYHSSSFANWSYQGGSDGWDTLRSLMAQLWSTQEADIIDRVILPLESGQTTSIDDSLVSDDGGKHVSLFIGSSLGNDTVESVAGDNIVIAEDETYTDKVDYSKLNQDEDHGGLTIVAQPGFMTVIKGDAGKDLLVAVNHIIGSDGNDAFKYITPLGTHNALFPIDFDGGEGDDTVDYSGYINNGDSQSGLVFAWSGVGGTASLPDDGGWGSAIDNYTSVENLVGTVYDDVVNVDVSTGGVLKSYHSGGGNDTVEFDGALIDESEGTVDILDADGNFMTTVNSVNFDQPDDVIFKHSTVVDNKATGTLFQDEQALVYNYDGLSSGITADLIQENRDSYTEGYLTPSGQYLYSYSGEISGTITQNSGTVQDVVHGLSVLNGTAFDDTFNIGGYVSYDDVDLDTPEFTIAPDLGNDVINFGLINDHQLRNVTLEYRGGNDVYTPYDVVSGYLVNVSIDEELTLSDIISIDVTTVLRGGGYVVSGLENQLFHNKYAKT
jgi:hypothetical protein